MQGKTLIVLPEFLENAASLSKETRSKLFKVLRLLSGDWRHPSLQCKKVKGSVAVVYECRVDQGIRLIYDVVDSSLRCWYVGEHDAALSYASSSKARSAGVPADDIELVKAVTGLQLCEEYLEFGSVPAEFASIRLAEVGRGCKGLILDES